MKKIFCILLLTLLFCVHAFAQTTASSLMSEGQAAFDNKDYAKAQELFQKALKEYESNGQAKTTEYAQCLHNIGRCLMPQKKYKEGKEYTKKAMELRKSLFGEVNDDYITSLTNYAQFYCLEDDYNTAKELQLKAIGLYEKLGHKYKYKFSLYDNMGRYCALSNDADNGVKYWDVALSCVEKYGTDYENVIKMINIVVSNKLFKDEKILGHVTGLISDFNEHKQTNRNVAKDNTDTQKEDSSKDEQSIRNCATSLSALIKMANDRIPLPFDPKTFADTLYNKLYSDPANISLGMKYIGKFPLQAYFLMTNDKRVDYADIEKCLAVTYKYKSFRNLNYLICATYYAIWADEQGLSNKAIAASERALVVADELFPKDSVTFWKLSSLATVASNSFSTKDWRRAAKYQKEILRIEEMTNGNDSEGYLDRIGNLSVIYSLWGKTLEADSCRVIMQEYMKRHHQTNTADYAEVLADRIDDLVKSQEFKECETLLYELDSITKPSDKWYLQTLLCGIEYYTSSQNYSQALTYFQKAVNVFEKDKTKTAEDIYPWVAYGNIPNSSKEIESLVKILEDRKQEDDVVYLSTLSDAYSKVGRFKESAEVSRKADALFSAMTPDEQDEVISYVNGMYVAQNNFEKQIEITEKQIENGEKSLGKNSPLVLSLKRIMASLYNFKGEYYKSEAILDSCLTAEGTTEDDLLDIYEEKASVYLGTGDYAKACELAEKLLANAKNPATKFNLYDIIIVSLISEIDISTNDVTERTQEDYADLKKKLSDYCEETLAFVRETYGDGHINTIYGLTMSATAAYFNGDNEKMLQFAKEAERQTIQSVANQEIKKNFLEGLAVYYTYAGDYQKALSLINQECLKNEYSFFAEKTNTLEGLSEIYQRMGNLTKAQEYYVELSNLLMDETGQQMNSLTAQERQNYWRRYRQTLNNAGKFVDKMGEQNSFAGTVYDLALFSKSLLLNSDASFRRSIEATGDQALIDKFTLMQNLYTKVNSGEIRSHEQYKMVKDEAVSLEKELLTSVAGSRNNTDYQSAKWNDIQLAIGSNDIAVELIEYITSDEKAHYGASIIRKNWKFPVFVEIGEKKTIEKQLNDLFYDDTAAKAAWSYIMPYLEGVSAINISLAGDFHKTPIENLSLDGVKTMAEKYTINRLTSTAELLRQSYIAGAGAVAYGGMKYKDLEELPGSDEEANEILRVIKDEKKNRADYQSLIGDNATKDSFLHLSSAKKEYIHVSTHGYYHDDVDDNPNAQVAGFNQNNNKEDKSLMRSGLYFNNDEQLTAYDISMLNLTGLDVVSLSACQTGLGDISGDGVFGLQRGFKKAGAKSIVMTLWSVANEPTKAFMTSFYTNLLSGKAKTKAEALEMAKQEVKSNPAWESPDCWAGFVLLDGLK